MSRDIPFDENAKCDRCEKVGSFDLMGDHLCPDCIAVDEQGGACVKEGENKERKTDAIK